MKDEIANTDNWKTCMYYSCNYHLKQKYISQTEIKPTSKRHFRYSSRCIHDFSQVQHSPYVLFFPPLSL